MAAKRSYLCAAALGALALPAPAWAEGPGQMIVRSGELAAEVTAIDERIVRIRIAPHGTFGEDASWAVEPAMRAHRAKAAVAENRLATSGMIVSVDPASLRISVTDAAGKAIVSDTAPLKMDGTRFVVSKALGRSERIFAMGDKTGPLDRRGRTFVNWNTDFYGFKTGDDPIYKSIPFYISSGGAGGAYGLLLDNSWRSWFDLGHRDDDAISFGAQDGPITYYVIAGPSVRDVVRGYADLTGHSPLPPRWVLGYQQSRWSYMDESEVRTLAARLRQERVPTDVIWLDIDFQDRARPFTIDRKAFPGFEEMIADLKKDGIKTVTIADLHIANAANQGYRPYDDGMAKGMFVRLPSGQPYVAPVWPGPSVFPDFTWEPARKWWGDQLTGLVKAGAAGIWNDMNEPAIFESPTKTMPLDVRHRIAGSGFAPRETSHAEVHNVYGMENSRATYEGLRRLRPDERAFVLTRASFAGGQRYAATWTGDNSSSWDHLKLSVSQTLNLGLSGFAWTGADVGGFTGGPTPELLTRWFQFAAFAPIFRDHSQKGMPRAEPWVHGPDQLAIRRRFVEERYRLLPYLYSVAEASARTGDPFNRPVFYDYPASLNAPCDQSMSFTVGRDLLVAGSPKPEASVPYDVCLPGLEWYDYWSGNPVKGTADPSRTHLTFQAAPTAGSLPVYVRAGAIVPRQPLVQSTAFTPQGALEVHVYPGEDCAGTLYDDDGISMGYRSGKFYRQDVTCTGKRGALSSVNFAAAQGKWQPWWRQIDLIIHDSTAYTAATAGKPLQSRQEGGATIIRLSASHAAQNIVLSPKKAG